MAGLDEIIRVENWKFEQFVKLGFDAYTAKELVDEKIDYHLAALIVEGGCPIDLAEKILR